MWSIGPNIDVEYVWLYIHSSFFHLNFLQSITYNTADTTYHLSSMLPVVPRVMNGMPETWDTEFLYFSNFRGRGLSFSVPIDYVQNDSLFALLINLVYLVEHRSCGNKT